MIDSPRTRRWLAALLVGGAIQSSPAMAARLDIELTGVENDRGFVRVAVCTPETFTTKRCPYVGALPAHAGRVVISLDSIPAGRYAVQAYHDEDGKGRVRRGLFGLPADAIGFSRDAPLRFGPPSFEDAVIDITEPATATRVRLRHIGG